MQIEVTVTWNKARLRAVAGEKHLLQHGAQIRDPGGRGNRKGDRQAKISFPYLQLLPEPDSLYLQKRHPWHPCIEPDAFLGQ